MQLKTPQGNRCGCEVCVAMETGDREALGQFEREGKVWAITPEQLAYFRDHLGAEDRRSFDRIQEAEGNAAAFGFTLGQVLDEYPDLRVNFPGRLLQ